MGRDKKVLVICVKFNDLPTTRLKTAQDWVDRLNAQARPYYQAATYNKTSFIFETLDAGPEDGWFQMDIPSATEFYINEGSDQYVIDIVDQYADFEDYHHFLVITNHYKSFGQSTQGYTKWYKVSRGWQRTNPNTNIPEREMYPVLIHEWNGGDSPDVFDNAVSNVSHELGHVLGVRTHYGTDISFNYWGVMETPTTPPPHFLGWAKNKRGWLEESFTTTLFPGSNGQLEQTVLLKSHSEKPETGTYLVKIPFSNTEPFIGYVVEYRKKTNYDNVPEEGVLIYYVDENPNGREAIVQVQADPDSPGESADAAYEAGDVFYDSDKKIRIEVLEITPSHCKVRFRIGQ